MSASKGTASTRLLAMGFMKRAAAAEGRDSAPSTPTGPPAKRMRMSNGAATPVTPATSDRQRLAAAEAEEERQRSAVMDRLAAEAGETRWVLDVKSSAQRKQPYAVSYAGYSVLDGGEESSSEESEGGVANGRTDYVKGRMVFGKVNSTPVAPQPQNDANEEAGSGDGSGSEESEDDSDDSDVQEVAPPVREGKKNRDKAVAQKQAKLQEQQRLAALRRKKEINLNARAKSKTRG